MSNGKISNDSSSVEREESVDGRILRFIGRHRVMTLACSRVSADGGDGNEEVDELWCCNLFYAYLPATSFGNNDGGAFVFTSPEHTRHAAMFVNNPRIAASIVLESRVVARLQGLQIQGVVRKVDESDPELLTIAKRGYLKRFPFAAAMLSDLWVMEVTNLKYTDNTLGFGTKLHWAKTV